MASLFIDIFTNAKKILGEELVDDASKGGKKAGDALGKGIEDGMGAAFGGIQKKLLGLAATLVAGFTLDKMISEAMEAEDAINSLNAALLSSGNFSQRASDDFVKYAETLSSSTTVATDKIVQNAAQLAGIGGLSGQRLQEATKASLDLAAAMNIDVSQAFDMMTKAATGNVTALQRRGIEIDNSIPKEQRLGAVLEQLSRFSGLAEQKTNTFSGALAQLNNANDDILESLGKMITQSPEVIAVMKFMAEGSRKLAAVFAEMVEKNFIGNLIKQTIDWAIVITEMLGPSINTVYNTFQLLFNGLMTGIQGIIVGFAAFAEKASEVGNAVGVVSDATLQSLQTFRQSSSEVLEGFKTETQQSLANIYDRSATDSVQNYLTQLQATVANAKPFKPLEEAANKATQTVNETMRKMREAAQSALVGGISQSFAALGGALAKGENGFKAFSSAVIGALGGLAIQMGTVLVGMGLGFSALGPIMPIWGLSGASAIAAGIGLITLGGAIQALAGGGGGGAPVGGGAAGATGGGASGAGGGGIASTDSALLGQEEEIERKPTTTVNVNVQGNVLNTRDTALHIADVMNEHFNSTGVVLTGAV